MRCLFLKQQILEENEEIQIFMFLKFQQNNPNKGDWVSTCLKDLSKLNISVSIEEIKIMSKNEFKKLIKADFLKNA